MGALLYYWVLLTPFNFATIWLLPGGKTTGHFWGWIHLSRKQEYVTPGTKHLGYSQAYIHLQKLINSLY